MLREQTMSRFRCKKEVSRCGFLNRHAPRNFDADSTRSVEGRTGLWLDPIVRLDPNGEIRDVAKTVRGYCHDSCPDDTGAERRLVET